MIKQRIAAARREDRGFTLVELMVVVLVIGILLAIAIPTFLGARSRAQDSASKASLRNAQTAAGVIFTDNNHFSSADVAGLTAAERSLTFVVGTANSTAPDEISVTPPVATAASGGNWGAASLSLSGECYYIRVMSTGAVYYGHRTSTTCRGSQAATYATATSTW